jgi:thiamine biosynthesis lipoprotein
LLSKKVAVARNAMATRFEIVVHGESEPALRAAAEAALEEVARIEAQLSLYKPESEVADLNRRAAREWVRVGADLFRLLGLAHKLSAETDGAFDLTIAPLVRCWGFMGSSGKKPSKLAVSEARQLVGMSLVELDEQKCAVRFARDGVMLDFGAIGKGYAIDAAVDVLREAGVTSAIVHGGTSTVYGLGKPPNESAWKIAIEGPPNEGTTEAAPLSVVELRDEALSVSAVWGKSFTRGGKTYGHIIDPRTGDPADAADLAAVALRSATETDALSTALLTLGLEGHERIATMRPGIRSLVMKRGTDGTPAIKLHKMDRFQPLG